MVNRYSSRRQSLTDSFLNKKLKDAKAYDRIAGYFSSSILEAAGESIESIKGKARIICNSDLDEKDVMTARVAKDSLRKEWCSFKPEELKNSHGRFKKLYELLSSGKLEVRVLPNERFGLIHGKAGVITMADEKKTCFLGSVNESLSAWELNYELIWEDDSAEAIKWVEEEFDMLWNDRFAMPLSESIIEDIKRISERKVFDKVDDWKADEGEVSSVAVESPVYRKESGLWEHQKYFVEKAFSDHKLFHGARYILADQVGLGKTIQLAMTALLMALHGNKPILVIVPKTLLWQWQSEMNNLLDMPSAVWNGRAWVDENEVEYRGMTMEQCPRKVGIISQGLIVAKSPHIDSLLKREYECIIVDECHRARRSNLGEGKEHHSPVPNNLYEFLLKASLKTKSMLLATATPIQLYPVELWDLMNILSQKNDSVLGSPASYWRKKSLISKSLNLIMGKKTMEYFDQENWEWIRNPLPPKSEGPFFDALRMGGNIKDEEFVFKKSAVELDDTQHQIVGNILFQGFYKHHNPYIRHVVRRERAYLENEINPGTGESYLEKIEVKLFGDEKKDALVLSTYLKEAYIFAEEFCKKLGQRNKGAGFLKTLLLKRIGSSIEAGKNTGRRMLNEWNTYIEEAEDEEDYKDEKDINKPTDIKDLTAEETVLLRKFVRALESTIAIDPKYEKTVELLKNENWLERGTIIFSQYLDTARWVGEKLSKDFPKEIIGLYAGGSASGIFLNGDFKTKDKETIKKMVEKREIKILVGTDAAGEGLNLQALGSLINIDLPWNPTKLEQRKGRIQRIGQKYDTVYIYNMRYKDSIEDKVHSRLSQRLKSITEVFGQLPDVLEDVWINIALGEEEKAMEIIDEVPKKHPFETRYNDNVRHIDWESCAKVLDNNEIKRVLKKSW
ncbi:MAG: phospholipase D-like domain-containing protein [Firmicutes bacterium]|nr:phospholipase D-like domain-containing protein [Bacillota bacterium]